MHIYIYQPLSLSTCISYLLPLITYPICSKSSISSLVNPISPQRGIRLPSSTKAAIASPSPGRRLEPKLRDRGEDEIDRYDD